MFSKPTKSKPNADKKTRSSFPDEFNVLKDDKIRRFSGMVLTSFDKNGGIKSAKLVVFPWDVYQIQLDPKGLELANAPTNEEVVVAGKVDNSGKEKRITITSYFRNIFACENDTLKLPLSEFQSHPHISITTGESNDFIRDESIERFKKRESISA